MDKTAVLRTSQLIVGALAAGVAFFGAITFVLGEGLQPLDVGKLISLIMAGISVTVVPVRFLLPAVVAQTSIRQIAQGTWVPKGRLAGAASLESDDEKLAAVFLQKTIIAGAVLEGAAFANLVAFMLEGQIYSLGLGLLLLLGILMGFPTRGGMEHWIERGLQRLRETRDLSGLMR